MKRPSWLTRSDVKLRVQMLCSAMLVICYWTLLIAQRTQECRNARSRSSCAAASLKSHAYCAKRPPDHWHCVSRSDGRIWLTC